MSGSGDARRRLDSVERLGGVVTTMRSLASVRVHQYRRTMRALDASTLTLDRAARAILLHHPELAEPETSELDALTLAVVFGSDRGLCGPFNDRMARYAAAELVAGGGDEPGEVLAVGRRLASRMRAAGVEPSEQLPAPSSLDNVDAAVAGLMDRVDDLRRDGRAGCIWLIYARPAGATGFEPRNVQVLPIDPRWLRHLRDRPWPSRRVPMEFSEPRRLVQGVIRQRLALAFVKAFGSSLAAENAARLGAMEAASSNIDERLAQLRNAYHSARQAAVTEELLDIQAAAESLRRD